MRVSTGLLSIIAAGPGNGAAVNAAVITAWNAALGAANKKVQIKKIFYRNRAGVNANLLVGFGDLTLAGSVFRQVLPSILMLNGVDGGLTEEEIPLVGNTPEGFAPDTTAVTGSLGSILIQADQGGAAPADIQVEMELEVE